jgi:hypothetical protein
VSPPRIRSMSSAIRKLAAELSGRSGPGRRPQQWFEPAVVYSVTPAGARDGNALCTVTWRGTQTPAAYSSSYAPVVGHVVLLGVQPPSVVILCRLIGTP